MNIRTRIFLVFTFTIIGGVIGLVTWVQDEIRPRYMEAQEDPLVDMANLLASIISSQITNASSESIKLGIPFMKKAFDDIEQHPVSAQIYGLYKDKIDIRIYVTNAQGIVIYDSDKQRDLGEDYSQWHDVHRTLRGEYGARSTEGDTLYPENSTMYIAAPILYKGDIVGVVSVGKPTRNVTRFTSGAFNDLIYAALFVTLITILFAFGLYRWITQPLQQLQLYAKNIQAGVRVSKPELGDNEMNRVADAIAEMRTALDGKAYINDYVQTLTHELKSPTAAIRGAAELLQEDMSADVQLRFINNIHTESQRLQDIIDRLLELAAIESRPGLENTQIIKLATLFETATESFQALAKTKNIEISSHCKKSIKLECDSFLIRQAIDNLIKNALEFSTDGGQVMLQGDSVDNQILIKVIDQGSGIPEYAKEKAFDRFFSLPRKNKSKGSGLGLSFVKEIASLHGGKVSIFNNKKTGVTVEIWLPQDKEII